MPMYPPWRKGVDPGDLVYGLGYPRKIFRQYKAGPGQGLAGLTIDLFVTNQDLLSANEQGLAPERNKSYLQFLRGHPKYGDAYVCVSEGIVASTLSTNQHVRHKCKGGLAWATHGEGQGPGHLHFVLDGLDMEAVVTKTQTSASSKLGRDNPRGPAPVGTPQTEKYRSYTGAELRWLFRNRHESSVQQRVQFWYLQNPSLPPWAHPRWMKLWQEYHPRAAESLSPEERQAYRRLARMLWLWRWNRYALPR
jgi:hypothetical protein